MKSYCFVNLFVSCFWDCAVSEMAWGSFGRPEWRRWTASLPLTQNLDRRRNTGHSNDSNTTSALTWLTGPQRQTEVWDWTVTLCGESPQIGLQRRKDLSILTVLSQRAEFVFAGMIKPNHLTVHTNTKPLSNLEFFIVSEFGIIPLPCIRLGFPTHWWACHTLALRSCEGQMLLKTR